MEERNNGIPNVYPDEFNRALGLKPNRSDDFRLGQLYSRQKSSRKLTNRKIASLPVVSLNAAGGISAVLGRRTVKTETASSAAVNGSVV